MMEDIRLNIDSFTNYSGLGDEESEKYAKIIYLCLRRGDMHSVLLWAKEAIDSYYNKINVYATSFEEETISSSVELSQKVVNILERNGYIYWRDLEKACADDIISIKNIGIIEYERIIMELHKVIKRHTK